MALPQKQSNQSLNEQFLELFTGTAGVHAVTTIKDAFAKDYFTKDLLNQQVETRENVYFTPNTTKNWSRKKAHVCQLNAITVDLDVYNVNMTIEQALYLLPYVLKDENIFYPTAIQISGNGIYLHWKLDGQIVNNRVMVSLYEKITATLQAKLKRLGADGQATDVLHLFRMPGTLNSKKKYGTTESYIVELNEHLIYELQDFTDEVLPEYKPRKRKKKRVNKGKKTSVRHLFNPYTLALARARDLERLARMRNYDLDGHRHNLIFFYTVFLTQAKLDNYEERVHTLNDLLTDPLKEVEVKAIFKTIEQKLKTDSDDPYDYTYLPKNSTLINRKFAISASEQALMETIIGQAESRKRDSKRKQIDYEPIKKANKNKKEQRNEQIYQLHKKGLNNTQIAKEIGVHRNTVANVLKAREEPK